MLTQTRRRLSEKESSEFQLELEEASKTLSEVERSARWKARMVPVVRVVWVVFAALAIVGFQTGSPELLTLGLVLFLVTVYFALASFFPKTNYSLQLARQHEKQLQDLVRDGVFVESQVTSSRCFRLEPFDDETPECYFDLGEQGTIVIWEFYIGDRWQPNTDLRLSFFEAPGGTRFRERVRGVGQTLDPIEEIQRGDLTMPDFEHLQVIPVSFDELLKEMRLKAEK